MFLKTLTMKGFKSFADPTTLELEPGVTVVVGPNGSGKSNVVDAVTWVLGAQGPRSLRSAKMEDVIFAGTASRSALGRAEVSLTIDNADGQLPVDLPEVTISRTLFRSGDSEYAINGAPCRLLDIQELLSDSGVGRSQHMIVGQGQLAATLDARPEERRAIIEEAAGVLKHRRRKERAERRLAQAQENLERLGDLVREVRRQMRPLERQAVATRSHQSIADELRAVQLFLIASDLAELATRRSAAGESQVTIAAEEEAVRLEIAELDAQASNTVADLSGRREEDLAEGVGHLEGLLNRSRGQVAVVRERGRTVRAALDAAADEDVVSTLVAEASDIDAALISERTQAPAIAERAGEVEQAESLLQAAEAELGSLSAEGGDDAEHLRAANTRSEVLARQAATHERNSSALAERLARTEAAAGEAKAEAENFKRKADEVAAQASAVEAARNEATAGLASAESKAADAETAARGADEAQYRAAARAEALSRALRELEGSGGREAVADLEGVVGSLLEVVEIDKGWEDAFASAVGGAVAAVVVRGGDSARSALRRLRQERVAGLVLSPMATTEPAVIPDGAEPLRPHIRPRAGAPVEVASVLDSLLARTMRIDDLDLAVDVALERPDLVVVTGSGDRFARSGWRVASSQRVVTVSAVEEAQRAAERAAAAAVATSAALESARELLASVRVQAQEAIAQAERATVSLRASSEAAERSLRDADRLAREVQTLNAEQAELAQAVTAITAERADLEAQLPALRASAQAFELLRSELRSREQAVVEQRREVARLRRQADVEAAEHAERIRVLESRRVEIERRLEGHAEEREAALERRQLLEADVLALSRIAVLLDDHTEKVSSALDAWRARYHEQLDAVRAGGELLEALRQRRTEADRRSAALQGRRQAIAVELAELTLRLDGLRESLTRDHELTPELLGEVEKPQIPEGVDPIDHEVALAKRLNALGPINPLALEELAALEERHNELEEQVGDVRKARRELFEVLRTLDEEIMQAFAAAAADVNEHFSMLVGMLFPGGVGRLVLTDPADLLHTGVEIEVKPMGRNVRRISLLSGGEKSMAALAFLFAVFRSRPSPFYLMDEVEAALDDVNLHRFLGLIEEFRNEAQLIIVSHQKRTMERADALYGVTVAPGGSSQVVSQKVAARTPAPEADSVEVQS